MPHWARSSAKRSRGSQHVSYHVLRTTVFQFNDFTCKQLSNEMIFDVYVFCSSMVLWVFDHGDSRLIVLEDHCCSSWTTSHINCQLSVESGITELSTLLGIESEEIQTLMRHSAYPLKQENGQRCWLILRICLSNMSVESSTTD